MQGSSQDRARGVIRPADRDKFIRNELHKVTSSFVGPDLQNDSPTGGSHSGVANMIAAQDEVLFRYADPKVVDRELVRKAEVLLKSGKCGVR